MPFVTYLRFVELKIEEALLKNGCSHSILTYITYCRTIKCYRIRTAPLKKIHAFTAHEKYFFAKTHIICSSLHNHPHFTKIHISITLASQVTNQHNCIHLFLSSSYCMEFPLQKLYSNKIKITALSPLDDTQTSHLKKRRTDTHHMSIMQSHFISFITVSEENIHSCPCNKECHYHFS